MYSCLFGSGFKAHSGAPIFTCSWVTWEETQRWKEPSCPKSYQKESLLLTALSLPLVLPPGCVCGILVFILVPLALSTLLQAL